MGNAVAARNERRVGHQTVRFLRSPRIVAAASIVGPKEGQGPLGAEFDAVTKDDLLGEKSWERAEAKLYLRAVRMALEKGALSDEDVDYLLGGDLNNQIIGAHLAARETSIPFLGLYAACATWTESLTVGAALVDGGFARRVVAAVSSHHDTAERQFRYPTELGVQRTPTATWTVTGSAACVLADAQDDGVRWGDGRPVTVREATLGQVHDWGLKDPNNMGAAMAPAAADTIDRHLRDTGRRLDDYDAVITGDLGLVGRRVLMELLGERGHTGLDRLGDCGELMFDRKKQDVHCGGSGCACSAAVFAGHLLRRLRAGDLERLLLVSTGCLHSLTSYQQGESIPTVAHAVAIEAVAL